MISTYVPHITRCFSSRWMRIAWRTACRSRAALLRTSGAGHAMGLHAVMATGY